MSQSQLLPTEHFSPSVSLIDNRPATTSLAIAEHFGKRHPHVMRDIRNLCAGLPDEIRGSNFGLTFRTVAGPNNSERQEEFFTVYFDGFILLVMGYTGKKALGMKLAYIAAFNAMREELENRVERSDRPSRRTDPERKALTAIINTWVGMAPIHYANARAQVNAHFGVASVDRLTVAQVKEAIQWVQGKIDALPKGLPEHQAPELPQAAGRAAVLPGIPFTAAELAKLDALADRVEALNARFRVEHNALFKELVDLIHKRVTDNQFRMLSSVIWSSLERAVIAAPNVLKDRCLFGDINPALLLKVLAASRS